MNTWAVVPGVRVFIKPEWQDAGDSEFTWTAITEPNSTGNFKVLVTGENFRSVMELHVSHVKGD